ncbi:hypothetical protein PC113_g12568 [Phytophthora cactorum]|uniref:Uncharacterized protein n=2 Tax=Phytophthora cactorum TaxID=29920 RepID=A0A8T1C6Z6_9STRA|nr:hypothetical protein PC113_g12568 [Phytophthora cactorum]KAG2915010.1 hypothetical protein PC117_g18157 [Phytophthora cactorum]KAG3160910.1 hypothetical protein C6341_g13743 [Phytophthora cactorum]
MTSVILKLGLKMTRSPKNTIKSKLKGIKMVEAANTTVVAVAAACESTHVCAPPATWEEWIVDMRKNRYLRVSTNCLLLMHSKFAPVLFSSRTRAASLMFIRRFLKQNRLTVWRITYKGRKKRSDMKAVANKYSSVYNMDQTAIYVDMNGRTTVDFVGASTVDVVQCSAVNGGPVSQEVFNPSFGAETVEHTVQKKANCDVSFMLDWIERVWKPSVDGC